MLSQSIPADGRRDQRNEAANGRRSVAGAPWAMAASSHGERQVVACPRLDSSPGPAPALAEPDHRLWEVLPCQIPVNAAPRYAEHRSDLIWADNVFMPSHDSARV